MNGVINVYKEAGVTSFQVVAAVRKIFNVKKTGHTGTLDPMAEGVLPICLGSATRFADILTAGDKQYIAHFKLGQSFDTFDTTGTVRETSDKIPSKDDIIKALQEMTGETELVVPAFSAKKIDGKRAYELARKGDLEDAGTALMRIDRIELLSYDYPEGVFVIDCGKGTYVRSVIHKLGLVTGAFAAMSGLIRSKNGPFLLADAVKLDDIRVAVDEGRAAGILRPVQDVLDIPKFTVSDGAAKRLMNGISPKVNEFTSLPSAVPGSLCLLMNQKGELLALGEFKGGSTPVKLSKVFNAP